MMAKTLILPSSYINLTNQETNSTSNTNNTPKTVKGSNMASSCTNNTSMTNETRPNYKLNSSCSNLLLRHNHAFSMSNSMSNTHIHNQNKSNELNETESRLKSDSKSHQTNNKSNLKNQLFCSKLNKSSLHVGYLDNADDFNRMRKQLSRNHLDKHYQHNQAQPCINHVMTDNHNHSSNQRIKITNDNGDEMSLKEESLNELNNQRSVNLVSTNGLSLLEEKPMSVSTPPTPTTLSNQLEFVISPLGHTSTSSGSDETFLKLPSQSQTKYLSPMFVNKSSQISIDESQQPSVNKNKQGLFKTAFQSNSSTCLFQNSQTVSDRTLKLDEKKCPAQTHQLNSTYFKPSSSSICINHNTTDTMSRANNRLNKMITIAYNKKNLSPPFSLQTSELNLIKDASSMLSVDSHHSTCCSLTCADFGHHHVNNLNRMDNLSDFSDESLCELKTHILEPSVLHAHSTFSIYDLLLKKIELGLSNLNKSVENHTANSSLLELDKQNDKRRAKKNVKCLVKYKTTDATRNDREGEYDEYEEEEEENEGEGSENENNVIEDTDCESMSNSGILCNNLKFIKSNNKKGLKSKSQSIANLQPSLLRHNKPEHVERNIRHLRIYNRFFKQHKNHKSNKQSLLNNQESSLIRLLTNPQQNSDYMSIKHKRAEKQQIEQTSSSKSNQDLNSFITYNQLDDKGNNYNQTTNYTNTSNTNDENEDAINEKAKFKYGSRKGSQSTSALDSIKVLNDLSYLKSTKSSVYLNAVHQKRSNQQAYRQKHHHLYDNLNNMPFNLSLDDTNPINNNNSNNSAKSSTYNLRTKASAIAKDIKSKATNLLRRRHTEASFSDKGILPNRDEIFKWQTSFEHLLKNKYGIALFRGFLKTEFSDENIEFWLECEEYKFLNKDVKRVTKSKKIYSDYVAVGAPREVNLEIEIRTQTAQNILNPTHDCFDRAQKRIQALMEKDSYPRFLESDLYKNLLKSYPPQPSSPTSSNHQQQLKSTTSTSNLIVDAAGSSSSNLINNAASDLITKIDEINSNQSTDSTCSGSNCLTKQKSSSTSSSSSTKK